MIDREREHEVRAAAFAFLDGLVSQYPDALPAGVLQRGFTWHGQQVRLLGTGPGIWKPALIDAALSIMTTAPRSGQPPPYDDDWVDETRLSYAYQGQDPDRAANRALRLAWEHQLPLVYLYGVERGFYLAQYPAFVVRDRPADLRVDVVFTAPAGQAGISVEIDGRSYAVRPTRQRLHQHGFRVRVLRAYQGRCAMCSLRRGSLLDAAHIVPDGHP